MSAQTLATRRDHVQRVARALGGSPWVVSGVAAALAWSGFREFYDYTRYHPVAPVDELTATVQATAHVATPTGLAWVFLGAALLALVAALATRAELPLRAGEGVEGA